MGGAKGDKERRREGLDENGHDADDRAMTVGHKER